MEVFDQQDNRCSPGKTSWIKGHEAFGDIRILTCNYFDGNAINLNSSLMLSKSRELFASLSKSAPFIPIDMIEEERIIKLQHIPVCTNMV